MNRRDCGRLMDRLSEYIDGELDRSICAKLESHVDGCAPCKVFIRNFRRTVAVLKAQSRRRVPSRLRSRLRRQLDACKKTIKNKG